MRFEIDEVIINFVIEMLTFCQSAMWGTRVKTFNDLLSGY